MGPMSVAPVCFNICAAASSLSRGSMPASTTLAPFCCAAAIFEGAEVAGRTTNVLMGSFLDRAAVCATRATAWPKFPVGSELSPKLSY